MGYASGTREVGPDKAVALCPVPQAGVQIRNLGGVRVYLGGPDVGNEGDAAGYPVDPGGSETFPGTVQHEAPIVPAPEGDMALPVLYARAAAGSGITKVSFIAVS